MKTCSWTKGNILTCQHLNCCFLSKFKITWSHHRTQRSPQSQSVNEDEGEQVSVLPPRWVAVCWQQGCLNPEPQRGRTAGPAAVYSWKTQNSCWDTKHLSVKSPCVLQTLHVSVRFFHTGQPSDKTPETEKFKFDWKTSQLLCSQRKIHLHQFHRSLEESAWFTTSDIASESYPTVTTNL